MKVCENVIARLSNHRHRVRRLTVAVLLSTLIFGTLTTAAVAEVRRAFVVGIDRYDNFSTERQLDNAVSDADAVAASLSAIAYDEVTVLHDISRFEFNSAWQLFLDSIGEGDTVTFFFSGHGVAIDGDNYLLPRSMPDLRPEHSELIESESLSLNNLLQDLQKRSPAVTLMILDACRNDPFATEKSRDVGARGGLAGSNDPPSGTFIMYSAAAGMVALDGVPGEDHPNSVYTRHLLDLIPRTDLSIAAMARELRQRVNETTKKVADGFQQSPAYYDGLIGDFCLPGCSNNGTNEVAGQPESENIAAQKPAGAKSLVQESAQKIEVATARPASDSTARIGNQCPSYSDSQLYRPRRHQITVGPQDAWESSISDARPDTEILLRDGEYLLSRTSVAIAQPNVTVRSASGNRDAVLILGLGYATPGQGFMIYRPGITIADISMINIRDHAISMNPAEGAGGSHIYNVHLTDVATQFIKGNSGAENLNGVIACSSIGYTADGKMGDNIGAINIHNGVDWTIRDNYIYNITGDGSGCGVDSDCGNYESRAPAVNIYNHSRGSIVERNTIVDSFRGISLGLGDLHVGGAVRNNFIYQSVAGDAGIELWAARNVVVEHNTVILAGSYPGAIEYRDSVNLTIRNNLLSAVPLDRNGNSNITVEGNISDASVNDLVAPADPHLLPDSRALGAGVSSTLSIDIDGNSRSGRPDVGADQLE